MHSLQTLGAALFMSMAALGQGYATELLANGSFEANGGSGSTSFIGWQSFAQAGSQGGFVAQHGSKSAVTPVAVAAPPNGTFAAMSDQPGPGSHALYQDIAIPAGYPASLTAKVYVQSASSLAAAPPSLDYTLAQPNQQARIDVMHPAAALDDVGAGVLANVFQWPPAGTAPSYPAQSSGYETVTLDLSAYVGQTIRLRLAEVDNRQSLFFGVDALSIQSGAPVVLLGSPMITGFFVQGTSGELTFTPVNSVPGQTVEGYTARCIPAAGGGPVVTGTSVTSPITVTGLSAGESYNCTVAANTATSSGPSSASVNIATPPAGSNATVVSMPSTGGAVTSSATIGLSGAGGASTSCTLAPGSGFQPVSSAPVPPPQGTAAYPLGLLSVSLTGCSPGATVQVEVALDSPIPGGATYWKYGPTPTNPAPHWYPFGGFSASGNSYTLTLIDGSEGDDDLDKNGTIKDPGGVMVPVGVGGDSIAVPLWNLWALLGASLVISLAAVRRRGATRR